MKTSFWNYMLLGFLLVTPFSFGELETIDTQSSPVYGIMGDKTLYIVNEHSNSVTAINTENKNTSHFPTGFGPTSGVFLNGYLYINNTKEKSVTVIDTKNNTIVEQISVPKGADFSLISNGKLYVQGEHYVSIIDTKTLKVTKTLYTWGINSTLFSLIISNNKSYVFFPDDINMGVLNTQNDTLQNFNLSISTGGGAVVGKYAYISNPANNSVSIVDTNSNTLVTKDGQPIKILVGQHPMQVVAVGEKVYVSNTQSATISVIDAKKNTIIKHLQVGEEPNYMIAHGVMLFILNAKGKSISVINTQEDTVSQTIPSLIGPQHAVIENSTLYVVNAEGNNVSLLPLSYPQITQATVGEKEGSYKAGDSLTIQVSFDKDILSGSSMQVTLNNNKSITLSSVAGKILSGKYTISDGEGITTLSIARIENADIRYDGILKGIYSIPEKKNISDLKKIQITGTNSGSATTTCQTDTYKKCSSSSLSNVRDIEQKLLCENFISSYQTAREKKTLTRLEILQLGLNIRRPEASGADAYKSTYSDISKEKDGELIVNMIQTSLDQGFIYPSSNGLFEPNKPATRIEAYSILMASVCMKPTDTQDWIQGLHQIGYNNGIIPRIWSVFDPHGIVPKSEAYAAAIKTIEWAEKTGGCTPAQCEK